MAELCGLNLQLKNVPELDPGFLPISKFFEAYK